MKKSLIVLVVAAAIGMAPLASLANVQQTFVTLGSSGIMVKSSSLAFAATHGLGVMTSNMTNSKADLGTKNATEPSTVTTAPLTAGTTPITRYDFEDGTLQGWFRTWGGSDWILTNSTDQAFTGSHALSLSVPSHAYPAIENTTGPFTGLIGHTFYIHFWSPSGENTFLTAQVFVQGVTPSGAWKYAWGKKTKLTGGWQTISVDVPSSFTQIKMIGFQAGEHGHWIGEMYFDSVSW